MTEDERQLLRQSAEDAAACQVTQYGQTPMWHKSLYYWDQGLCEIAPLRDEYWFGEDDKAPKKRFYSDIFCSKPIDYQLTSYYNFCNQYVLPQRLGNDFQLAKREAWTLHPATRFRLPLVKQYGFDQPFMTARVYHQVEVIEDKTLEPNKTQLHLRKGSGLCALQMFIYKANPAATNGKSLLMFHGGGGHQRGFHVLALKSRIPEYTEQGYTVYMPFYRLLGNGDTNTECSDATWDDMKQDAENALSWVEKYKTGFGDKTGKVTLFAQGSGALLAGRLHTQQPEKIESSILFYPILDTASIRNEILKGEQYKDSRETLERLLGAPLEQVKETNRVLRETSFWQNLATHHDSNPPMVLLHGLKDKRVPSFQTIGGCIALSGNLPELPLQQPDTSQSLVCGRSRAHLLAGAEHQLDYCFTGVECPAGDKQSRKEVNNALKQAHLWLKGAEE